ncbi:MAG: aminotransferase class I/II-fold pyridoxal phosphate-dependent enzyme, partial [Intestinibacter sp.]
MLFSNFKINTDEPVYIQIKNYIKDLITKGLLPINSKLPSTRELCSILNVSRNSVLSAYDELKTEGLVYSVKSKGTFVKEQADIATSDWKINWTSYENEYAKILNQMDTSKNEIPWESDLISFKSISPAGEQFDMEELKRAFLNRFNLEGHKLLNYGYAQGYKPLIDFLFEYMSRKNVDSANKDILMTNGFTEALNIVISSLTETGDYILCENPTHNVSLKIFKAYNLNVLPMNLNKNSLDFKDIEKTIKDYKDKIKFAYI